MRAKHARLIREGIRAARQAHRLREMWELHAQHAPQHPLTMKAYRATVAQSRKRITPV